MAQLPSPPTQFTPTPPLDFKDRRTGLMVFGVLSIILGALFGCLSLVMPLALIAVALAPNAPAGRPPDPRALILALVLYVALAAAFVWIGVGSIRLRRWARPMMLIVAWTWLLTGVVTAAFAVPMLRDMPAIMQAQNPGVAPMPPEAQLGLVIGQAVFIFLFMIVLPGVVIAFYQSRHVKATLEHFDPRLRWTDRCPLPVLGLSVGLGFAAASLLVAPLYPVVPFFGIILSGAPAVAVYLVLAAALAVLAVWTYRLRPRGWWGTTVISILLPLSFIITLARVDLFDLYRRAGIPEHDIELMRQFRVVSSTVYIIWSAVLGVAIVGYMLYVRKFFVRGFPP